MLRLVLRVRCLLLDRCSRALAGAPRRPDPMAAVRADSWADAQAAAAGYADPVAEKLVLIYRLLAPARPRPARSPRFMASNPDWPAQALLERRREEAIAADPDEPRRLAQCDRPHAVHRRLGRALLRCAEALRALGRDRPTPPRWPRRAWVTRPRRSRGGGRASCSAGPASDAGRPMGAVPAPGLADPAAAARQVAPARPRAPAAAEARLALQRDDPAPRRWWPRCPRRRRQRSRPGAGSGALAAPGRPQADALALWQAARRHRRARRPRPEQLRGVLGRAQPAGPPAAARRRRRGRLCAGRRHGQTARRERVATPSSSPASSRCASCNDPARRCRISRRSPRPRRRRSPRARAHVLAGPGRGRAGDDEGPEAEYEAAAAWPTTFYGQLAALALGETPAAADRSRPRDPPGPARRARLHRPRGGARRRLAGRLGRSARGRGLPAAHGRTRARRRRPRADRAAGDGRRHARHGGVDRPPDGARRADAAATPAGRRRFDPAGAGVDPALALAIMRQESSFDTARGQPGRARAG